MKVGDLVKVKNPAFLVTGDDEKKARELYPWKFEIGVVVHARPWCQFEGQEVCVSWPSDSFRTILVKELRVVSEVR